MANLFEFIPGYSHYIYRGGREPLFFLLVGFLATFVAVRAYTRVGRVRGWRSGSVRDVHLHHLVPGILASLASATAIIAFRPGDDVMRLLSLLFGVGAALTLDEFALILHLDDVYWTKEGRSSVEATLMGAAFGFLCLLASLPLGGDPRRDAPHWLAGAVFAINLSFGLIAFIKGKPKLGTLGIIVPFMSIVGAVRLAAPQSLWAHRFYSRSKIERSEKRALARDRRYTRLRHRLYDLIGGAPHLERGTD
ncbi:MAG TPA: hypothetical protein VLJ44_00460 [Gaiellaceae bacterium]|nr:hypothetical protein [Gaiellaceae bacterium]